VGWAFLPVETQSDRNGQLTEVYEAWKRGQEPIAKWPKGCSALLVPDLVSKHLWRGMYRTQDSTLEKDQIGPNIFRQMCF